MKLTYKMTYKQSTNYSKCQLISLCTFMKAIYSHHILTTVLYFKSIPTIHCHSSRVATCENLSLPRAYSSQGQGSLKLIGPKVWSEISGHIKFRSQVEIKQL